MERILIGDSCEVVVGRGLPDPLLPHPAERVAVLVQPGASEPAERVLAGLAPVVVLRIDLPDREEAKDLGVVAEVYRRLARFNLGRGDAVVGVGGGAVTDVAGFVAATWLRGVASVMVPTTLLGAVDASIGGKTGVNVRLDDAGAVAKNLVGAFWHPARVAVDLDVLDRLPGPLRTEGTAEILKAGLIADPGIVEALAAGGPDTPLERVVGPAIAVKAAVVSEDFREGGRRAILNFGHTIGHGIEGVTGMPHGHAVAVGMIAAGAVSAARYGFDLRWLTDLVFSLDLPVAAAGVSREAVLDLVARDKKRDRSGIRMVLLRSVGDPVVEPVGSDELALAMDAIGAAPPSR
jgi:3-dehydroquinate synthetase